MDKKQIIVYVKKVCSILLEVLVLTIVVLSMDFMIEKGLGWILIATAGIVIAASILWSVLPSKKWNINPPLTLMPITVGGAIMAMLDKGLNWIFLIILYVPLTLFIIWLIAGLTRVPRGGNTQPPEMPSPRDYNEYMKQMDEEDKE